MTQRSEPKADNHTRHSTRNRTENRAEKSSVRFLKFKLTMLLLCALPVYGVLITGLRGGSWLPAAVYPVMSVIAFALYGHDKKQARPLGQRTPEKGCTQNSEKIVPLRFLTRHRSAGLGLGRNGTASALKPSVCP